MITSLKPKLYVLLAMGDSSIVVTESGSVEGRERDKPFVMQSLWALLSQGVMDCYFFLNP
jgi:hypothetical protein